MKIHCQRHRFPAFLIGLCLAIFASASVAAVGIFDQSSDVGKIIVPGAASFDSATGQYRVSGSGWNIWGKKDAMQFLWKKLSGDLTFSMDAGLMGEAKEGHRKVCAMLRQGLDADDAYVDVAVHGDGNIALQYRIRKADESFSIHTDILAPATVKIERVGDQFFVSVSKDGGSFQAVGNISLVMSDPIYVGIAVSSHDENMLTTAMVSNVVLHSQQQKRTP